MKRNFSHIVHERERELRVRVAMAAVACFVFLFFPEPSYAATGSNVLGLYSAKKILITIVKYLVGFSAMFSAVSLTYQMMNGRKEAIPKTVISLLAFIAGFVLLNAFDVVGKDPVVTSTDLRSVIYDILETLLAGVAIINIGKLVAKMIQGNDGSFHKLAMTVLASIIGLAVLKYVGSINNGVF